MRALKKVRSKPIQEESGDSKEQESQTERILIAVALIVCALIVGYQAFYIPQSSLPVIYGGASEDSVSLQFDEEYEAQPLPTSEQPKQLDLNTASKEQLEQTLPGIGAALAERIVSYREAHSFQSVEELQNVEGIGPKTFEKIKPYVVVN